MKKLRPLEIVSATCHSTAEPTHVEWSRRPRERALSVTHLGFCGLLRLRATISSGPSKTTLPSFDSTNLVPVAITKSSALRFARFIAARIPSTSFRSLGSMFGGMLTKNSEFFDSVTSCGTVSRKQVFHNGSQNSAIPPPSAVGLDCSPERCTLSKR